MLVKRHQQVLRSIFTYFCHTLGASPVAFRGISEWGQETVSVIVVITAVTQEEFVVVVSPTTHPTDKRIHL